MKKLLFALLIIAVCAMPAFASVQSVKVGGRLVSEYLNRANFDLGASDSSDESQSVFLTHAALRVDADLTDNVSATVELLNERAWGDYENTSGSPSTDVQISLAYATLREMLYSPLTVIIGRQKIAWGNKLILDGGADLNDSSIQYVANDRMYGDAFDAVRVILDYNPLTIEAFAAKINSDNLVAAVRNGGNVSANDDSDLYGVKGSYELGDDMNTVIEAYFLASYDRTDGGVHAGLKPATIYTPGILISTNPLEGLGVSLEVAHQSGAYTPSVANTVDRDAWAAQFITNYSLPVLEDYNPVLTYKFSYFSGEDNAANTDSSYNAWNELYEGQFSETIFDTLFDLSNLQIHTVALAANPMEDVTATVQWSGLWRNNDSVALTSLNQPDGTAATVLASTGKSDVGQEVDFILGYNYTEDVSITGSLGWFIPGEAFDANNRKNATQANVVVGVNF